MKKIGAYTYRRVSADDYSLVASAICKISTDDLGYECSEKLRIKRQQFNENADF